MPLPNHFWGLIFSYIFSGHLITLSQNYTIQPYILVNDENVFYHENFHTKKAFWAPLFSHNLNYQCKQTVHTPEFISVTCHVPITSKLWNTTEKFWMGGRLPRIIFCSSVTFRQTCRETKCIKALRHCLYASFLPHCTCRCRHKSRLGGPGRPPAVHESRIQNGEHISYNWVNFSSLVTAVVITFNFRVHLHHIPYSTAR